MTTWKAPLILAVLTATGLFVALVDDGAWDAAGAVALATPLAACLWFGWLRRSRTSNP